MNQWQQGSVDNTPWSKQHGDDRVIPAIVAGAVAAVVGGAVWAAIVAFANLEVGWVAWGIGLLVGVAMAAVTQTRGRGMAMLAAGLAAVGLVAGKSMIVMFATEPALAQEIEADGEWLAEAAAFELNASEALPADVQQRYDALAEDDTLPDALWEDMLHAGESYIASADTDERDRIAANYASYLLSGTDFATLLRLQISLWDLLWFGLAITTAWKIMAGKAEEEPAAA
jgi:hypothetical protein